MQAIVSGTEKLALVAAVVAALVAGACAPVVQEADPEPSEPADRSRAVDARVADIRRQLDNVRGRTGILASHLNFGHPRRGWDFRSPGRGDVKFGEIIRVLNEIGYQGPLSIEWEDSGMDREFGAREACEFTKRLDFAQVMGPYGFDSALQMAGVGREMGRQALMIGYINAFTFYTLTAAACLPLLLLVRFKRQRPAG